MRKIIDMQMEIWKKDISKIEFDLKSRDEIPKLLIGLQYIYSNTDVREKIFEILNHQIIPKSVNKDTGRPGMDIWKILVLGSLRINCNWDYDKLHNMANNHSEIRQMMGHDKTDFKNIYPLQTIKDNFMLLKPETLAEINKIVVDYGHSVIAGSADCELHGSCDSFVFETDVHYPTDTNILFDAIRKMITVVANICESLELTAWRQSHHNISTVKAALRRIEKLYQYKPKKEENKEKRNKEILEKTRKYIDLCRSYMNKVQETYRILSEMGIMDAFHEILFCAVNEYIKHAMRQIDQIQRRVFNGEKIPHNEKVFSIFEPHTELIKKGKAGVPHELGVRVCIMKDQYGFILHHIVMEKQTDDKVAVPIVTGTKEQFPNLSCCSFDKGFYTPKNKEQLAEILDDVILPKKGKLSVAEKEIEHSENFVEKRKKHSAVESSINALENHGLDRCLDHGIIGFKRYTALAVLARNIQILGHNIQQKELKRHKRKQAA